MQEITTAATVAKAAAAALQVDKQAGWGRRKKAAWENTVGAVALITLCPMLMIANWVALEHYHGSLTATLKAFSQQDFFVFAYAHFPRPSMRASAGYAVWLLWQALLYTFLPGATCQGQRTPGGHLLSYTTNGLMAWALTHLVFLSASVLGLIDPAIIANHWEGLLVAVNVYGFALTLLVQCKGYLAPSFPEDQKKSGSWAYDFWAGVELNPRLGKRWDLKFFHNGRPGIVAWTLIDLSWAAYQYQMLGFVTRSMLVVLVLHTLYVVDFFYNEDWYTRTIDISHDHFGFMLAWGDTTFLPAFYTLQVQYLARYPTQLSLTRATAILLLGLTGYTIFRSANYQRDHVRSRAGNANLWGRPAQFIRCKYLTHDGKEHSSILLTSGWWGVSRHSNYLADLIQTWAMCAVCGFTNILPWSYFIFMCILLYHRAGRDERRCHTKYGDKWDEYCRTVPYRIVPGLY